MARLDVNPMRGHKHRLEPDAFLSNVPPSFSLRTLADAADCSEVLFRKPVLIALEHQLTGIHAERHVGHPALSLGLGVVVVISILEQLQNEPSIARIKVLGEAIIMVRERKLMI